MAETKTDYVIQLNPNFNLNFFNSFFMNTKCLKLILRLHTDCHKKNIFSPLLENKPKRGNGKAGYSDQ